MRTKYPRIIIEVEKRLGFLYISKNLQKNLPIINGKVKLELFGEEIKEYKYNSDHSRIFGLTAWYKKNKVKEGTFLSIQIIKDFVRISKSDKEEEILDPVESEEMIINDTTGLSSAAKGNIVEDRIKELILLHGQGLLDVYKPVIDQRGIDLIVLKAGTFFPIYIQVKSRFNVEKKGQLVLTISGNTFKAHHSFFIIGAFFNPKTFELDDRLLFVPSEIIEKQGFRLKKNSNIRLVASYKKDSGDQWKQFIIQKKRLVERLLEKFEEINKYIK